MSDELTKIRVSAIIEMLIVMNEKHKCKDYLSENGKRCRMCDKLKLLKDMK